MIKSNTAGLGKHLPQTRMSSHLTPTPPHPPSPPFTAGETGSAAVVAPRCDPGPDSGAWTFNHCAQCLHQRMPMTLGVHLAAWEIYAREQRNRNPVRVMELLLRWQRTPQMQSRSLAIPSHVLRHGGRIGLNVGAVVREKTDPRGSDSARTMP